MKSEYGSKDARTTASSPSKVRYILFETSEIISANNICSSKLAVDVRWSINRKHG